ncbi:Acidic fibroblast growth factor intracellular-binding protein [Halotydeus destructor]|nr:Acidic fibroblast growth factor intracellular-binding protein [Halotydeus destructor]
MMFTEVDVFIGNNTMVDPAIYQYWLDGYTAPEAAKRIREKEHAVLGNTHEDLIISDVLDHYRSFQLIEKLLHNPMRLSEQWTFQITPKIQRLLIEKYYEFDDSVIREILGKKLSGRNRKDMDDVSDKTNVGLKSCRRQFDNVKRVYRTVEDLNGSLVQHISSHFLLPEPLAKKYAAVVYMSNNRFETNKRRLHYLKFDEFIHCAYEMMINWSCKKLDCKYEETAMDVDREFLQDLRDLRSLTERDYIDDHKIAVMRNIKGKVSEKIYLDLDAIFKNLSRNIINIASGLNHSKEMRDLFVDMVEKVIEPCKQIRLSNSDMEMFLKFYTDTALYIEAFSGNPPIKDVWTRFMVTLSSCVIKIYH